MRKLFKERKLFKGGNYLRKYGILSVHISIYYSTMQSAIFNGTFKIRLTKPFRNIATHLTTYSSSK